MIGSPHRLILASAGTGKTYQLTGHFLRLLLEGVEPERILATTFTRKAAGEILDRVLQRLLEAATNEKKRAELAEQAPGCDVTPETCVALLARLTRRLDRFKVRTLDAFFVHLTQVFGLDLDLPPEWTLVDDLDDEKLRAEVLGRLLSECDPAERLELLRGLQRDGAARSVHATMLGIVRNARTLFLESTPEAWSAMPVPEGPTVEELPGLAERLGACELPLTKGGTPDKNWQSNFAKAQRAVATNDWDAFVGLTLVQAVLAGKTEFSRREIPDACAEVLGELAHHAARTAVEQLNQRNEAARAFLERFEETYQELKRERGAYRFEDLPLALALAPGGGTGNGLIEERRLDLWFRLDGRIDHLLLDEFQDTAPMQWRTLSPLAGEILADGLGERSFFCVGDVKQSIYGWRQAEPRLLAELAIRHEVLQPPETLKTLACSYRSSTVVLDTVNRVFGALGRSRFLNDPELEARTSAAQAWQEQFEAHTSAREELPGAAVLVEARKSHPEQKPADAVQRTAVERIVALAHEAPHASIGVLVRTGKPIPRLLHALRARGVRASGEGGNPLVDAESVQVFLSALHLADHPSDTAAALHVVSSPLSSALGLEPGDDARDEPRRRASRALRAALVDRGYGAFAASLLPLVEAAPAFSEWDRNRFRQLVDLAYAHDARAGLRPTAFADIVRSTSVEDPTASRVSVMTIHKSKGLEFDVVVLPELEPSLVNTRSSFLCVRPDPFGPITRVSQKPRKFLREFSRPVRELCETVEARELSESLCVLYVAMTRAARRLEMIVPPPNKPGRESEARNYANLLRDLLEAQEPDDAGVLWRHPDSRDDWYAGLEAEPEAAPAGEHVAPELAPSRRPRSLARRTASGQEGGAPRAADLLRRRAGPGMRIGTLVHRLFEEVEWLDDFAREDGALLELLAPLEPDPSLRARAVELFRGALSNADLCTLLTRPTEPAIVLRERTFGVILQQDGVEAYWPGSIDRLVLIGDADRPTRAEVIDFKTDAVDASGVAARIAVYRPQLEAYRRVVAAQTGLDEARIACRLAFVGAGIVHELPLS